ncbi:hypothetical protein H4219_001634 [Mycoemilia scoparia]|uniref:Uncharacterized protein n=1 Tax=Mycoemilia scoparia TaxID=417184 RepID=A0A9W8A666_9FUNG|nr:hypothetical protein H4219_001634 [Mycoemilia scoparia]
MPFTFPFGRSKSSSNNKNKYTDKRSSSDVEVRELRRQIDDLDINKGLPNQQLHSPLKVSNNAVNSTDISKFQPNPYDDYELKTPLVEEIREKYGEIRLTKSMTLVNITKSLKPTFYFGRDSKKEACAIKLSPDSGKLTIFVGALEENRVNLQDHFYCKSHTKKLCKTLHSLISIFDDGTQVEMIITAASNKDFSEKVIRLIENTIYELESGVAVNSTSDSDSVGWAGLSAKYTKSPFSGSSSPKAKMCPFCLVKVEKSDCLDIIMSSVADYKEKNPYHIQHSSLHSYNGKLGSRKSLNTNIVKVYVDNDVSDCD